MMYLIELPLALASAVVVCLYAYDLVGGKAGEL